MVESPIINSMKLAKKAIFVIGSLLPGSKPVNIESHTVNVDSVATNNENNLYLGSLFIYFF